MQQLYNHWQRNAVLPKKPVVITFDDGYRGDISYGLKILAAYHFVAVMNIEINHLTGPKPELDNRAMQRVITAGWEIDSHTVSHPDLTQVSAIQLARELSASRTYLQSHFKLPVNFFCYPSGRYNQAVIKAVVAAGYLGATTTNVGLAQKVNGLYEIKRLEILRNDQLPEFSQKIASA